MSHLRRACLFLLMALTALAPLAVALAQDASVYPLPADLYILTSEQRVLRIDATTGEQTPVSPEGQPVGAFELAPGSGWYAYRTLDSGAVIVAALNDMSGFVIAFDEAMPAGLIGAGLGWSPDAARLAYTVPEGVRITRLPAFDMAAEALTVEGGPWADVAWIDHDTLLVTDSAGASAQIGVGEDAATVEPGPAEIPLLSNVEATLTPEGVRLADGRLVPMTAGSLAFDWGPLPLPELPTGTLPAALYFLSGSEGALAQVWALTPDGAAPRAVTASEQPILDYTVAAGRAAYVSASELRSGALDGSAAQPLATLSAERVRPTVAFNAAGSRLAFTDDRGLWTIPADGSQPPALVLQNVLSDDPNTVRVYRQPIWSSDDAHLLVTIGLWEGSLLGVVDLASGSVAELAYSSSHVGAWADDGRVAAYSAFSMYGTSGLYLLDPASTESAATTLLGAGTPVYDVAQAADGSWSAVVGNAAGSGPQWMRLLSGSETAALARTSGGDTGAAIEQPRLAPATAPGAPTLAAGLWDVRYGDEGAWGEPVIADLSTGALWAVPAPGPVSQMEWAR